jgi:hypothetical protein
MNRLSKEEYGKIIFEELSVPSYYSVGIEGFGLKEEDMDLTNTRIIIFYENPS